MRIKLLSVISLLFLLPSCQQTENEDKSLPILGRREVVDNDTIYHQIADFAFVDQDSAMVTEATFEDKIYVADFFFTSCPTICPIMKTQMLRVYEVYENDPAVAFLSHSIDPEHDTVAVLKEFSDRLGVESDKWHFVTGKKADIFKQGQTSYMVTAMEDASEPGGFIHSGAFILVDKDRHIRGVYDGTKEDQVDKLIEDIRVLKNEYKG